MTTAIEIGVKPKRMPRPSRRRTWIGTLVGDMLRARRGCFTRAINGKTGETLYDERESQRPLIANIGDRLVLSHSDVFVDEIALCEVVGITREGWLEALRLRTLRGAIAPTTRDVWIMQAGKAAA